ncbi:MAG: PAS domain S-box protein, partial [Promethearchaeota archaeon]
QMFATTQFYRSAWMQTATIQINGQNMGEIIVAYSEKRPDVAEGEGPFLKEERILLNTIAKRLGKMIERMQSEVALQESNERFCALFNHSLELIYVHDLEGHFIDANHQALSLMGYNKDEIQSLTFLNLLTPDDLQRAFASIERILQHGFDPQPTEYCLKTKTGDKLWVETTGVRIDRQDKPTTILGLARNITQRKQMEKSLQKSEQKYRLLFEESSISLWEEDFSTVKQYLDNLKAKGIKNFREYFDTHPQELARCASDIKIVDVNKATLQLYEATEKAELLENLNKIFGEESYPVFKEELVALTEGNTLFESEAITYTLSGKKRFISLKLSVASGYEESLSKVIISIIDLTAYTQTEKALLESEQKFRILSESSVVGVGIIQENRLIYVNDALTNLSKYSREEMLKWTIKDLLENIHPDDVPLAKEKLQKLQTETNIEKLHRFQLRLLDKFKECLWTDVFTTTIYYQDTPAALITLIDITEHKKLEEKLRNSEERCRALIEDINDVIYAVDTNGVITYISPRIETISGYKPSEITGKSFIEFIHPEDQQYISETFQKGASVDVVTAEYRIPSKSGEIKWFQSSANPIIINGEFKGLQGVSSDISIRKHWEIENLRLLEELKNVNAELSNYTSAITHDLKAPLRGIKYLIDWLLTDYVDTFDAEGKKRLNLLTEQITQIDNIIQEIHEKARLIRKE